MTGWIPEEHDSSAMRRFRMNSTLVSIGTVHRMDNIHDKGMFARKFGTAMKIDGPNFLDSEIDIVEQTKLDCAVASAIYLDNAAFGVRDYVTEEDSADNEHLLMPYPSVYYNLRKHVPQNFRTTHPDFFIGQLNHEIGRANHNGTTWHIVMHPAFRKRLKATGNFVQGSSESGTPDTYRGIPVKTSMGLFSSDEVRSSSDSGQGDRPLLWFGRECNLHLGEYRRLRTRWLEDEHKILMSAMYGFRLDNPQESFLFELPR